MLNQKQGTRVRISSHEKVINMSEVYIPSDSICSCEQCESISCFNIRNTNSGIPCTCMDCDPDKCFTWESNRPEYRPGNETRTVSPETSRDIPNVPETTMKCYKIGDNVKCKERLINTTNGTKNFKFSYFDNHLQNNTSDDHQLKEVFTKEEKLIGKGGNLKNLIENKNIYDFELKDSSSNENSDIIECNMKCKDLLKNLYGDPEIIKAFEKDGSETKICCQENKTLEIKYDRDHETQNDEMKIKQLSSNLNMPLPQNESVYSGAKELLTRKIRNSCRQKIITDNTKSDFQELYQIYTNEKKNKKCCNISKDLEKKYTDASEKKQDDPDRNKKKCIESEKVNNKTGTTESNLDTNTSMKITNNKCNHDLPLQDYKISRNRINLNTKSHEKYVSHLQSAAISSSLPDYENSRAELSAQIMNVPYADLKGSLTRKQSATYSYTCNSSNKIEKYDILSVLRRLKEIYKACSCKVCECIAVKSLFNPSDICKCEPCDCDECNGYKVKLQKKNIHAPAPDSGCPCVNCDRKNCRGVVKKGNYTDCDCKPSDYVRYSKSFTKQCSCTPCQCEKCKTSIFMPQMLTIANAEESSQQSNCDCEPCVCTNCTSNQSINPLFNRSDICKCEPCDCNECNGYMVKLQKKNIHAPAPDSGCPCVNCDRKNCRGVVKKGNYTDCDCKPSDYVSFTKKYSSSPGQCTKCKTLTFMPQNLMIANAVESFQQSNCDCEPCECTNCTSRDSAMTSNLMREVSTGMIVYGNCSCEDCSNNSCQLGRSNCRCDSLHRVIRKPMTEKKPDYGIHRVNIKENKYEKKTKTINNRNTITMFALSNNYPNSFFNYSNKNNSCECDVCECIVCKDKGKESVMNDSRNIEKQICNLNANALKYYESCEILHPENVAGKCVVTGHDAHSTTTNSKYVGYNYKIMDNNENFKKAQPKYLTFEKKCSSGCKNLVNVPSRNSTDKNYSFIHDSGKNYLLKRGTLLTPSMFEKKELTQNSCQIHVKPEKDNLRQNDLRKKIISNQQDTMLYRNKSQHNYFENDYNENIINQTPESDAKIKSSNSSIFDMLSKEVGTKEIYKINSVDFKKDNVSRVFFEHCKSNAQNIDSNAKLLDEDLMHMTSKPSTHCNKKLDYKKTINKLSQTSTLDRLESEDFFHKTMSSSDNDMIHLSSAESMSLVNLLCEERNLNIHTKNTRKFLQSLEKIPLKRLKIVEENVSYTSDKYLTDDIILDSFGRSNYSFSTKNNLLKNMDQDQLDILNCENKNLETNLTDKKINKYNIHGKNIFRVPVPKTIKQITPKEKTNFQMVERKPNNYNIIAKGGVAQLIINKPYSEAKISNSNLKNKAANHSKDNVNTFNDKIYLEIPAETNTAASAINFTEYDKCIDFEKSFKLLNAGYDKNKKGSPILRKNLLINQGVGKNKEMCSIPLLVLNTKNAIKSTNTISPYCSEIGFGNKALEQTKLQTEVNELPHLPLFLSQTNSQREKSKSKFNSELNCHMSNATSQTVRNNIPVDKEINCNMLESKENLKQSIQNLINMTLTDVVQRNMTLKQEIQILKRTGIETRNQKAVRESNEASSLNAAKSSCGGLRTSFVGLRKVSDHSVLLKWEMPRDLRNIQGYEVDGHPVKKILNPSRCMAVLTCLPYCEKLLLTIRTITNLDTCHNPVTTVIYNPKKNKSGL